MAAQQTLFSIIIPTYSRPAELANCLEAIAGQRLAPDSFEVIVVDDGSPAPPDAVVRRFSDRLDIRLLEANHSGPAAARNQGAEQARGRFLAFTDDDCRPAPEWLLALKACCTALPDHLIGGRTLNALEENPYAVTSQLIIDTAYGRYNALGAGAARFFASNNLALAMDGFRNAGGFDQSFTTSEDRELCDRWLHHGYRLTYAPEAIVYHAHSLNLRSLWRQHFGYGRGAWRFHRARARRGYGRLRPDWEFYRRLAMAPFARRQGTRTPTSAVLMLMAQMANGAGFLYEGVRHRTD
jgi:glycosyltransferase involved in cell wall biosynthesis